MTSYPANFIPIEEAFEEAVARLAPEARTVATNKDLSSVDEDEADRIYQSIDEAERRVERPFRDELAEGLLVPWVKSGGQMEILSDREAWRREALGIPGFEPTTHHLTNPGPNDGREVFIERKALNEWLDGFGAAPRHGGDAPRAPEIEAEPAAPMVAPMRNLRVEISKVKALVEELVLEKEPKPTPAPVQQPSAPASDSRGPLVEIAPPGKSTRRNRRRRKAPKRERVKKRIIADIERGSDPTTFTTLSAATQYGVSEDTFIKARNELEDGGELGAARERRGAEPSKGE